MTALGEYLDFTIAAPEKNKKVYHINGVPVESGDSKIEIQDLVSLFTGHDIDAKTIRESAWKREK